MSFRFLSGALAGILSLNLAGHAVAETPDRPWYVGLDLSVGQFDDTDISGAASGEIRYSGGVALSGIKLGYRPRALALPNAAVRFELELGGHVNAIDSQTGTTTGRNNNVLGVGALMVNAYYDYAPDARFSPYLGVGFGVAGAEFDKHPGYGISGKSSEDEAAARQIMAGVTYTHPTWECTQISLGYRYFNTDAMDFTTSGNAKVRLDGITSHEAVLGIAYRF
ncbi:MAG: porin family protein [Rhodobacteraceae bacterium]|nr:porin family protein [Paracoccaceae bacterium]